MKEAIDAFSSKGNNVTQDMLVQCHHLLLISEISQRGVVIPLDATDDQILAAIVNVAGKSLIDENNVKSPLIAGAAAVSAMIAEKCADIALQLNDSFSIVILKEEQWASAFQRCRDVSDGRFISLLDIATKMNHLAKEGMNICHANVMSLLLHRVAFGNFLRACAFSNPEQPPVFKRALESCLKGQALLAQHQIHEDDRDNRGNDDDDFSNYYTHDAIPPLLNLVRIALSKKNEKRANELYLRLVQSYIGDGESSGWVQVLSLDGSKLWNDINGSYIIPYKVGDNQNASSGDNLQLLKIQNAIKAKEFIDKVDDIHFDRESDLQLLLLHKLLVLQVMSAQEDLIVSIISNQRYVASVNRSGLSVGTAATATAAFETQARKDLIAGKLRSNDVVKGLDYDSFSFDAASMDLCQFFLSVKGNDLLHLPSSLVDAVCATIERQLERLILVAQTVALDRISDDENEAVLQLWNNVFRLIEPLLDSIAGKDEESIGKEIEQMPKSRQSLMVAASEGLFIYIWMTYFEGLVEKSHIDAADIVVSKVLTSMKEAQLDDKKNNDKFDLGAGKFFKINNDLCVSEALKRMEMLFSVSKYQRHLQSAGQDCNTTSQGVRKVEEIIEETIKMSKLVTESKMAKELSNKTGLPYMQFLTSWSGLFQSSWSQCNISEARSIIGYVRSSASDLKALWGRKLRPIEEILLDIGEADSECGVLQGGMLPLSRRLYYNALQKLGAAPGSTISIVLKAHCESFQLRMKSSQVAEVSDALCILQDYEETMKLSKLELCTLLCHEVDDRFYCWTSESIKYAIGYHVSLQRHFLADILLKAAKVQDAQSILEEAVKASPMNYDAAFSYGAFLLQIAAYDKRCSDPDLMKKAQSQLLQSARLDVSKADPFALLGMWFEIQRDLKRSVGCYSKALLIDPSNPVAGRGILRVKKNTDLGSVFSRAMDNGIYQSGWAWKASGDHSAFVVGDYERANKCYQQALRSHDICNPKQFRLNTFFSIPGESFSTFKEYSNTWSALGASYRHMGKYSAALRAFQAAYEKQSSDISYFCSWAQVEMELGLLNKASEKFQRVVDSGRKDAQIDACYGLASCMLASARQAEEEGKFGNALSYLKRGIATINMLIESQLDRMFYCIWKILGDLYSFGFLIPISAFAGTGSDGYGQKMQFIAQGQAAYSHIVRDISKLDSSISSSDVISTVLSTTLNDIGINCLLRARICDDLIFEGMEKGNSTCWSEVTKEKEVQELLNSALSYFTDALKYKPLSSCCWAGLGYSLIARNPVLAQHAFCTALQFDKSNVDAWANLCLLYLHNDLIETSEECVDSLTQVSDSALIWLVRGLRVEKELGLEATNEMHALSKAFDAYQASLQISRQQGALLGLSLMARKLAKVAVQDKRCPNFELFLRESFANLDIYLNLNGSKNIGAVALCGVTGIEKAFNLQLEGRISSHLAHILMQHGANRTQHTPAIKEYYTRNEEIRNVTDEVNAYIDASETNKNCNISLENCDAETVSIHVARQHLLRNPSDSLLWLQLSKALLQALNPTSTTESYEAVLAALKRSKETMLIQVSGSSSCDSVHGINHSTPSPSSSQLSEVFALSYSIFDIHIETTNKSSYDLQKSVVLDPENYIARSMIP